MTAEEIARALGRGAERREGSGAWRTNCPVHESSGEHTPSLSVIDKDGMTLWTCRVGCAQADITRALQDAGLLDGFRLISSYKSNGTGPTKPPRKDSHAPPRREFGRTNYTIRDVDGEVHAIHERVEYHEINPQTGKRVKTFNWRSPDGSYGLKGRPVTSLPLYGSETLKALPDGATVILTEGEKPRDALVQAGFNAVGTVTGAKKNGSDVHDDAALQPLVRFHVTAWPDADGLGAAHMQRHGDALKALGAKEIAVVDWPDAPEHADAADFEGDDSALLALINAARPFEPSEDVNKQPSEEPTATTDAKPAWELITAKALLAEQEDDDNDNCIVERFAVPGCVTVLASPRGLGKTMILHSMLVSVARGRLFLGRPVKQVRTCLIDRDNPRSLVKDRLRHWDAGDLENLTIATREKAFPLTDKKNWAKLPAEEYGLVALDSLGSATEGVDETQGGESGQAIAQLLDLATRGPAVLVLANTDKVGAKIRGSGVVSDRFDIVYEIRDLTAAKLDPNKESWTECFPEGGEQAWLGKSQRRQHRENYRLGFVCSKYRPGVEPDPFVLEIRVPAEDEWDVVDVTVDVEREHDEARGLREENIVKAREIAIEKLRQAIAAGAALSKTQGEEFLRSCGLKQRQARDALNAALQSIFIIEKDDNATGRGAKKGIIKIRI
jgi:AAA domain